MPGKGDAAAPARPGRVPAYRRAGPAALAEAAERLRARGRVEFPSQEAFVTQLRRELAREYPVLRIGTRRLRRLLVEAGALKLTISYARRTDRRPMTACPVCAGDLRRVLNRTLEDDRVLLGYACPRCGYWTHLGRRVPVRYGVRLRPAARPPTARPSG